MMRYRLSVSFCLRKSLAWRCSHLPASTHCGSWGFLYSRGMLAVPCTSCRDDNPPHMAQLRLEHCGPTPTEAMVSVLMRIYRRNDLVLDS